MNIQCPQCPKNFKTKNSFAVHLSRDCQINEWYVCKECSTILRRKDSVKRHFKLHGCHNSDDFESRYFTISDKKILEKLGSQKFYKE